MEKQYKDLLALSYQNMLIKSVVATRRAARTIPAFRDSKNGCIRITIVPLSLLADKWLGGGFLYHEASGLRDGMWHKVLDVCEREFIFKIDPEGSHTIQWKDPEDGHVEPVNCYAYSALKTAYKSYQRKMAKAPADSEKPNLGFFVEANGWSVHAGSICATVTLDGQDFLRIYFCTSGAESEEDELCSLHGMLAVQDFFEKANLNGGVQSYREENNYYEGDFDFKINPYIDGLRSPLEQRPLQE